MKIVYIVRFCLFYISVLSSDKDISDAFERKCGKIHLRIHELSKDRTETTFPVYRHRDGVLGN